MPRRRPRGLLVRHPGGRPGEAVELDANPTGLGRDNSNPIRLHDTEVSRRHAEVRRVDQGYRVVDLGSANGTYVNGELVEQAPLQSGDRLQLGQTVMLFSEGNSASSTGRPPRGSRCSGRPARTTARRSSRASRPARARASSRPPRSPPAGSANAWSASRSCTGPPRPSATSSTPTRC
ncbi:MAG: FHA domain-containing protein [Isosphaeraceae bacterium]